MTTGRKTGGKNFQKGNKLGNRNGRPPLSPEAAAFKKMSASLIAETASRIFNMCGHDIDALQTICDSKETTVFEKILASGFRKAIIDGDLDMINRFLDRVVGKPKQQVEVSQIQPYIIETTGGRRIELGMKDVGGNDE